jgi:hypothetical protein
MHYPVVREGKMKQKKLAAILNNKAGLPPTLTIP